MSINTTARVERTSPETALRAFRGGRLPASATPANWSMFLFWHLLRRLPAGSLLTTRWEARWFCLTARMHHWRRRIFAARGEWDVRSAPDSAMNPGEARVPARP